MDAPASPRRTRRRRRPLLALVAMLVTCGALAAGLEGLLRLTGLGDLHPGQASQLAYQQVFPPLLEAGQRPDGVAALVTNDARVPWQALLADKPAGGLRVLAVGGSATAGLGFSANVSYPRELERLLRAALPGREIEVLNLGVVALASSQERWIVDDVCRRAQIDVVLIYPGNNEFLEIHARHFAAAGTHQPGGMARVLAALQDTNLMRLAGGNRRAAARGRAVTVDDMANAQAETRVSETEMVAAVTLLPAEREAVVDAYEANLRAMVESARAGGALPLLMTVASNWQWQGRFDLPADWIDEFLGGRPPADDGDLRVALGAIDLRLNAAADAERHAWLWKRGEILSRLGRWDEAKDALRSSMNADPRLRRATDELASRMRRVAADTGAPLLDTIEVLGRRSSHGIVGDEMFYDYVHFTPRGCVEVAAAIFERLGQEPGLLDPAPEFELKAHVRERLLWYARLAADPLEVGDWLGLGDIALVHDRELWKHQLHLRALDERLAATPDDVNALVARANADFFALRGFDAARRRYERALELDPQHAAAQANLQRLLTTRKP